jgi:hypothetical protein
VPIHEKLVPQPRAPLASALETCPGGGVGATRVLRVYLLLPWRRQTILLPERCVCVCVCWGGGGVRILQECLLMVLRGRAALCSL